MAESHGEKSGLVWSLASWVAAIVGGFVVGWIVAKIFGEVAAGIIIGGVAFMIVAVLFVIFTIALVGWPSSMYLAQQLRVAPMSSGRAALMYACFTSAGVLSISTFWLGMRSGIRALAEMDRPPS